MGLAQSHSFLLPRLHILIFLTAFRERWHMGSGREGRTHVWPIAGVLRRAHGEPVLILVEVCRINGRVGYRSKAALVVRFLRRADILSLLHGDTRSAAMQTSALARYVLRAL